MPINSHFLICILLIFFLTTTVSCVTQTSNIKKTPVTNKIKIPPSKPVPKPEAPIFTIDTGGHMGKIWDVIFTNDGKYLVSASGDKTVRVWDVETGEIVRVLRGQIGDGPVGKIYAAALSHDNQLLALGGYLGGYTGNKPKEDEGAHKIRIINFHTGKVIRLLKGHENVIFSLAFSPDNQNLISGSADKTARIWNMRTGQSMHRLKGHKDIVSAATFSPDGRRAVTGSNDNTLRLWDAKTGKLMAVLKGHTDKVQSAAFTPDNRYLLSGSRDKTIRLWDGWTGAFLKVLASQNLNIESLSISPDSKSVLTGNGEGSETIENNVFSISDGKKRISFTKHKSIVLATAISPDGKLAATGGGENKEIYLWEINTGKIRQKLEGKGGTVQRVGFARDGKSIAWGKTRESPNLFSEGSLEQSFNLREAGNNFNLSMGKELETDTDFIRGKESMGSISIRTKNGKFYPTLQILKNNRVKHEIKRKKSGDYFYCLTLTPDGKTIIAGTSWYLIAFDADTGKERHKFIGHTGVVWGVAVSPDGTTLVSGSSDQTVKLWDISTGKNLLTIFPSSESEWVAWTPEGYYDSSLKGDKYIGWHINRGEGSAALYFPAQRFAKQFRNPLVVAKYLETRGELDSAIKLAEMEKSGRQRIEKVTVSQIEHFLPPQVNFLEPSQREMETGEQVICVKAEAKSLTNEDIKDIWFNVNGKRSRAIVVRLKKSGKQPTDSKKSFQGTKAYIEQCVPLEPGENRISVFASTEQNRSEPETIKINQKSASVQDEIYKPNLYVLSIGISKYQNPDLNLNLAHKDAQAIAGVFEAQKGKLYRNVNVRLLTDEEATGDNILDGLDWILEESTQKDVSVIFIAGHGRNDHRKNYYFMPYDTDVDHLRRTGVKWFDFNDVLESLPSKALLMVDTCHSGNITGKRRQRGLSNMTEALRELTTTSSGVFVMTASTGDELSAEDMAWGHGAFTKAIVEGLQNFKADYNGNNAVEIKELDLYVTERVKSLTNGQQHTTTEIPKTMPNFPIAVK
ncbi:MAG: caspase family protein [Desulfamplus sp.]|nr:caspase family protein [Desulfamplus sp.]